MDVDYMKQSMPEHIIFRLAAKSSKGEMNNEREYNGHPDDLDTDFH
jgi:hypothetical protein